ncbi:MAG: hypothetical protein KIT84_19670 [Labilithrix sp.]|nr:hypothetical protein [Labilithrix sp.]MCW5813256.1 hypothetical protein [Labilithrix sp.]
MRARRSIVIAFVVAGIAAATAVTVVARSRSMRATATLVSAPNVGQREEGASAIAPAVVKTAERVAVGTTTLSAVTLDADIVARLDGIETAVREGDLAALPVLARADLASEPEAAPAIIHAVASLAAQGGPAEHALAGKTLARWLGEEAKRDTRDASGNVVNLVEALGDLGGDAAVDALVDALDRDGMLDLPLQTTAAQRLAAIGDKRALPAVERFAARVAKLEPSADAFERELQEEARAAAADARGDLGR